MRSKEIIAGIEAMGIEYFIYLPCSTVKKVIDHFLHKKDVVCIPISREEEGFSMLAGLSMGGSKAVLSIQDSGVGNSLLIIVALLDTFHIPGLIMISKRGGLGEINGPLTRFATPLEKVLDNYSLSFTLLDDKTEPKKWSNKILKAYNLSMLNNRPHLLLVDNME